MQKLHFPQPLFVTFITKNTSLKSHRSFISLILCCRNGSPRAFNTSCQSFRRTFQVLPHPFPALSPVLSPGPGSLSPPARCAPVVQIAAIHPIASTQTAASPTTLTPPHSPQRPQHQGPSPLVPPPPSAPNSRFCPSSAAHLGNKLLCLPLPC